MKIYAVKYMLKGEPDTHKYVVAETSQEAMEKVVNVFDNKMVLDRAFLSLTYLGEEMEWKQN